MTTENGPADGREQRWGEIVAACLEAQERGQAADRQALVAAHPEFAEELAEFFAHGDRFDRLAAPIVAMAKATAGLTNPDLQDDTFDEASGSSADRALRSFGDYEILEKIARGGMAVVYKARQVSLNRVVALKMIRRGDLGSEEERRFRHEAEMVAGLDHPNIVPIYEVGEEQGRHYFSMKLMGGGSLARQLERFAADPRSAARLVATVARAVHHAHQRTILHRDLKPANILLDREGMPHVTDFGLAKRLAADSDLTHAGALVGTPSYMAPEQTRTNRAATTTATDVYGLGAILYALLTGRPPFRGEDALETLQQVREQAPEPPHGVNPRVAHDLASICLKCLEKEPRRRYGSAEALADDLDRFLAGKPIAARPVRPWERPWKWARRRPAAAALLAVSGAFVVAAVAGLLGHSARLERALAETRKQQERADANYQKARGAVEGMLHRLDEEGLADTPRLQELKQQQVEDALAFYQGVVEGRDDPDPAVRLDAARAYERTGDLQHLLGRREPAEANLRQAVALLEKLAAEHPEAHDYRAHLGHAYLSLGRFYGSAQSQDEYYYRKALVLFEQLAPAHPDYPGWQDALAMTHHLVGVADQSAGRLAEAESHYDRAAAIRAPLVREHPQASAFRFGLAEDHMNLGLIYHATGRPDKAAAAYGQVEALLEPLAGERPAAPDHVLALPGAYVNWGKLLRDTGRPREALARLDRGVALAEEVLRREPRLVPARQYVAAAHGVRAQVYEALGRHAEALQDWDRVVELQPEHLLGRMARVVALARVGEHRRAEAAAADLLDGPNVRDDARYNVACVHALCVKPARSDARLSPAGRAAQAERYASRAVALLRQLHEQGYFKDAGHAAQLGGDLDLGALRGRDDFRRLLPGADKRKGR
jgi:serine/threonine-protein kinase